MFLRELIAQCTSWVLCGLSLLLLFTLDYLSEHSLIYTGLTFLIAQNLPITCILLLFIYMNFVPEDNRKINNKNDNPNKLIIAKKSK